MKPKIILKVTIPLALVAALTLVIVKMFTLDAEIDLIQTIDLPALPVISELTPGDYQSAAVALDGQILQGTNTAPAPTASTAKMILGLAVMEQKPITLGSPGETIVITPEFYDKYLWYISHNGSYTPVITGEEISQYDALASVFLASSNNMADSLAIWAFGGLEQYRTYATSMLERYGVKHTTIGLDASGYSETTTSTAEDLAIIAAKLLEHPVLREVVGLESHTVPVAGLLQNTNQILGAPLNNGATVTGVKTGYIGDISGYNLVSSYEMAGHTITLAVMGASTRAASFDESKNILLRLSAELTPVTIVSPDETVGYYETWWSGRHDVTSLDTLRILAPENDNSSLTLSGQNLTATINGEAYTVETTHADFPTEPTFLERFLHLFGWSHE